MAVCWGEHSVKPQCVCIGCLYFLCCNYAAQQSSADLQCKYVQSSGMTHMHLHALLDWKKVNIPVEEVLDTEIFQFTCQ